MSKSLYNLPVMSLRVGGPIATALEPIINPHNLKIMGWWCVVPSKQRLVLLSEDVREIMPTGLAVNDESALATSDDLVRHREVLDTGFQLIDKVVRTKRSKIGKVSDYVYNDGMFVQKLYVAKSLVKILANEDTVIIDRSQILEVTDSHILVSDTEVSVGKEMSAAFGRAPATP